MVLAKSARDGNGKRWQFQFDAANRLPNTLTPLGRETCVLYNNRGLKPMGSGLLIHICGNGNNRKGLCCMLSCDPWVVVSGIRGLCGQRLRISNIARCQRSRCDRQRPSGMVLCNRRCERAWTGLAQSGWRSSGKLCWSWGLWCRSR